ncbi:MAG: glycosyl transferase family 2 [Halobacteriales archaeon SW_9_67_25]|nr:MAG: glycosyl transferase family 2 [Halobacteriales archaeon SW_9_67_25]
MATVTTGTTETDGFTFDDVSVVMGTYNEEAAIGTVLSDIERVTDGRAAVVCVDGSTDRTPEIAREHGARVIDTYPMESLPEFLEYVNEGYDVISGDRLYHGADAMPALNRLGNHGFAVLASLLLGERVHDTTTGMRAYRREVIEKIEWTENTGLSAELLMRPVARDYRVREVPIEYRERKGETKLDPLQGGAEIAKSILKVGLEERFR